MLVDMDIRFISFRSRIDGKALLEDEFINLPLPAKFLDTELYVSIGMSSYRDSV